ncbi:MAG TPA: flagellar basal body-associated protein FliL [Xanthobacteraceae bacterium]|jgi:flagellar FliL protein
MATTTTTQTEAESAADEGKAPAKRKFSLKLTLMVVGGLVALGGLGGGYYFFFADGTKSEAATATNQIKPPVFMDMPEVLVNLSNTGGNEHTQYLKVKVVLELPNQELTAQIQPVMPRLMDTFQTYLRELRPTDLDGSAGLYRLKEELTRRVNAAIAPSRINAVLFKEIVIQ